MKKLILLIVITTIIFSCCKTPEEKANALIKEKVEKGLYYPESYDPAETIIDSAFSPIDNPETYERIMKVYELAKRYEDIKEEVTRARMQMSIYVNPYDEFSHNEYDYAKEKYEKCLEQKNKIEKLLEKTKKRK